MVLIMRKYTCSILIRISQQNMPIGPTVSIFLIQLSVPLTITETIRLALNALRII